MIITSLELNQDHPRYKAKLVGRLSAAATEWLAANTRVASEFLLMNRPKRWVGEKD